MVPKASEQVRKVKKRQSMNIVVAPKSSVVDMPINIMVVEEDTKRSSIASSKQGFTLKKSPPLFVKELTLNTDDATAEPKKAIGKIKRRAEPRLSSRMHEFSIKTLGYNLGSPNPELAADLGLEIKRKHLALSDNSQQRAL